MFKYIYSKIPTDTKLLRKLKYSTASKIKTYLGVSDPYVDIKRFLLKNNLNGILDIGCFKGHTIDRFLDISPLPIYGFEPTLESFNICKNRLQNCKQVQLFNLALSDCTGTSNFHLNNNPQTNSLLTATVDSGPLDSHYLKNTTTIQTITLDDWANINKLKGRFFIKADVQGAEMKILNGAHMFFSNQVSGFFSEVGLSECYKNQSYLFEIHEKVKNYGFELFNLYPTMTNREGRAIQCDALWLKKNNK